MLKSIQSQGRMTPAIRFSMTAGVGMPVDIEFMTNVVMSTPQLLRKSRTDAIGHRRFAEAVYRAAIADGTMEGIAYRDAGDPAEPLA
jgi:hypothetical protein